VNLVLMRACHVDNLSVTARGNNEVILA